MRSVNFVVGVLVVMAISLVSPAENNSTGLVANSTSDRLTVMLREFGSLENRINRTMEGDESLTTPSSDSRTMKDFSSRLPTSADKPFDVEATVAMTESSVTCDEREVRSDSTTLSTASKNQPHQEQLIGLVATDRPPDDVTVIESFQEIQATVGAASAFSTMAGSPLIRDKVPRPDLNREESSRITSTTPSLSMTMSSPRIELTLSKTRNDLVGGSRDDEKQSYQNPRGSKIVKPSVASVLGKYAPYFEDAQEELNITARVRNTVFLDCAIGMLGNKTVTWTYRTMDEFRLLTVGRQAYSSDQRISLYFRYPTNWRLRILDATTRDSGLYECQVATYPPLVKRIHLTVTAPELTIMDDSGRIKSGERHLKAGSALRLRCEARDVLETHNETVIWTRGDEVVSEDISENRTIECLNDTEVQVVIRTIVIERATPLHAGNYSCIVPEKAKTTIAVHVLNGKIIIF
ncbi:hypothetical protein QAD02_014454 [Eretmocerus hayati]|uniref:Uncharacterized protein n=1 Tax=Eretmocerus hayati TaxID=131215 RepID=A0ACC2P5I2_9HYME|nr:hypothetical protein QAD02_014454 [Eretmocerus hayati]